MKSWRPKDVIALVAILVCGGLMITGHNSIITYTFCATIGSYVGLDYVGKVKLNKKDKADAGGTP